MSSGDLPSGGLAPPTGPVGTRRRGPSRGVTREHVRPQTLVPLPPAAIAMLRDKEPGSFVVRDSHSFRGAYGLAMKVATPPPSVLQLPKKGGSGPPPGSVPAPSCLSFGAFY